MGAKGMTALSYAYQGKFKNFAIEGGKIATEVGVGRLSKYETYLIKASSPSLVNGSFIKGRYAAKNNCPKYPGKTLSNLL